jgi:hypothetical protein
MFGYEKALEELLKVDAIVRRAVIMELLERKELSFVELSKIYVEFLQKEREHLSNKIMPLALHLAMYARKDKTDTGRNARRLIYECKYFEGSLAGAELQKEFSTENKKSKKCKQNILKQYRRPLMSRGLNPKK